MPEYILDYMLECPFWQSIGLQDSLEKNAEAPTTPRVISGGISYY